MNTTKKPIVIITYNEIQAKWITGKHTIFSQDKAVLLPKKRHSNI